MPIGGDSKVPLVDVVADTGAYVPLQSFPDETIKSGVNFPLHGT